MGERRMRIRDIGRIINRPRRRADLRGPEGRPIAELLGTATLGGAIAEAALRAAELHTGHASMAWPEVRWEDEPRRDDQPRWEDES